MTLPIPNLDDKRFEQLVEEARKLIPIYAPDWTDHNLHDPGITLIELFAWLSEMQLYSLNRITDRNYIKYLKLLGESPIGVQPAKVDITITDWPDSIPKIKKASQFVAEDKASGSSTVFETDTELKLSKAKLEKIIVYSDYHYRDMSEFNKSNRNFFYAFGENPKVNDAFYLGFSNLEQDNLFNLSFHLYEDDLPQIGEHGDNYLKYLKICIEYQKKYQYKYWVNNKQEINRFFPSAKVKWYYLLQDKPEQKWEEVDKIKDRTNHFATVGKIRLNGFSNIIQTSVKTLFPSLNDNSDNLFSWFKCEIVEGTYELPPRVERILTNTVSATQCKTISKDPNIINKDLVYPGTGLPDQVLSLNIKKAVIKNSIKIEVNGEKWAEIDDIMIARPDEKCFQVDYSENKILFGNGFNGKIPLNDSEIKICYKCSDGALGNIRAGAINKNDVGVEATNYSPAGYGHDAENIADAIIRLKKDMLVPYMAVTLRDYEEVAKMTPGLRVARAKAIADTLKNHVRLIVVPYSFSDNPMPTQGFKDTACVHVDRHRTITTSIKIEDPKYIKVSVTAKIILTDMSSPEIVKAKCIEELRKFLSPIKRKDGDSEWEFGRDVYKSDVYAVLEDVDGLDGVVLLELKSDKSKLDNEGNIVVDPECLVYSGEHSIEIITKPRC